MVIFFIASPAESSSDMAPGMLQGCSRGPLQSSMGEIGKVFSTAGLSLGLCVFIVCLAACILVTLPITAFFHRENQAASKKGKILQGLEGYRYTF
jgi:hypothetical protein